MSSYLRSRRVVIVCFGHLLRLPLVELLGQQGERAVHDLGGGGVLGRERARGVRSFLLAERLDSAAQADALNRRE